MAEIWQNVTVDDNNDDAKAIAIPRIFSEKRRAKNEHP